MAAKRSVVRKFNPACRLSIEEAPATIGPLHRAHHQPTYGYIDSCIVGDVSCDIYMVACVTAIQLLIIYGEDSNDYIIQRYEVTPQRTARINKEMQAEWLERYGLPVDEIQEIFHTKLKQPISTWD